MISSLNRSSVVGSSSAAGELSTSITTSPSMMQAVATSGLSVYLTVGNGFQNCRGAMASTMDSWLMAMEPA